MLKLLKRIKSKKRGFTLIELIVVIAILGILAAILVPSMIGIVGNARKSVNEANARSIYSIAQSIYTKQVTEGTAPTGTAAGTDYLSTATDTFSTEVKKGLGSGLNKAYTIKVGTDGILSVTYDTDTGGTEVTYPAA